MGSDGASTTKKDDTYDKWRANEDLRTLTEAKVISKDPIRMKHVRRAAKEKLAEIAEIKKYATGAG
ncbi:MAG: hypothetical protein KF686_03400 [Ramlibacter sp.]|nr:hypothetical protein [Ramlibacter sp.]